MRSGKRIGFVDLKLESCRANICRQLLIGFSGGRTAVVNVYVNALLAATLTTAKGTGHVPVDGSRMFTNMAGAIPDLFECGTPNIDRRDSLVIRRLLDLAGKPAALRRIAKV
jgi:hypothetical protein